MRIFGAIVQIAALSMLYAWEHFSFGSAIASEFISDEDTRHVGATLHLKGTRACGKTSWLLLYSVDFAREYQVRCRVDRRRATNNAAAR